MRNRLASFFVACIVVCCGQKTQDHQHEEIGDPLETEGNQALYDEVMKIHDEVMPRMNEIFRKKEDLKSKIANTPGMSASDLEFIEADIARLDSAHNGMMIWMREFNPLPDSLGEEKAREYLENEMEKIRKVREEINEVLAPDNHE